MFDHLTMLTKLIKLDLKNGPFLTGGYLTWLVESRYNIPSWTPNDIDICCRSIEQFNYVQQILEPLATNTRISNWLGSGSTYWTIDNILFQAFVHPVSVQERLDIVDYTVTAIASDGTNFVTGKYTLDDIAKRVIRLNDNIYAWPVESIMSRYKKYVSRGYVDLDNTTLNRLNQIYET